MKDLGKTIDRIVSIDPGIKERLNQIKNKLKRYPHREEHYWKETLNVLNSEYDQENPKFSVIKNIIAPAKTYKKERTTFINAMPHEQVIGTIPENIADKIRQYDRINIQVAKKHTEAQMTNDHETLIALIKKSNVMDLKLKKVWIELKDHFNLWANAGYFHIRKRGPCLVLVLDPRSNPSKTQNMGVGPATISADPRIIKEFFKFMGMEPPPGMFPYEG